jgi:hypothetical protein
MDNRSFQIYFFPEFFLATTSSSVTLPLPPPLSAFLAIVGPRPFVFLTHGTKDQNYEPIPPIQRYNVSSLLEFEQYLQNTVVEGRRALLESSRRVQDGRTQGAEEKTGAIASLEGPEFLRFAFGRRGVDASMKLTPDATDTIPQELFNQHCNSRKDPSSNFKTQAQGSLVSAHSN